jgi:uncharacterized phage infection (PIP) family protein YhgE
MQIKKRLVARACPDEMSQVSWLGLLGLTSPNPLFSLFFYFSINTSFIKKIIIFTLISLLSFILFRKLLLNIGEFFLVMLLIILL